MKRLTLALALFGFGLLTACGDLATSTPDATAAIASALETVKAAQTPQPPTPTNVPVTTPPIVSQASIATQTAYASDTELYSTVAAVRTSRVEATALSSAMTQTVAAQATATPTLNAAATKSAAGTAAVIADKATHTAAVIRDTANAKSNATISAAFTQTQGAIAKATADHQAFLDWAVNHAPTGNFKGHDSDVGVNCKVEYLDHIGDFYADDNSKFIAFGCNVSNNGSGSLYVNPTQFTLVTLDGYATSIDSNTFSFTNAFKSTDVPAGSYSGGWIAFLMTKKTIPGRLVWKDFYHEVDVVIVPS